ncbi:hypothetical protein SDC9_132718 [bioreactor metagenome]|uniref:Uncharacterized protein n=1 Tax=bioreactor metagenome TaxID=1076179 RepID=A0A645D8V6_9ZZZZ
MAAVLHQQDFCRHREGLVARAAAVVVACHALKAFRVDLQHATHVEGAASQQLVGERQAHRQAADTRHGLAHLLKRRGKAVELADELLLGVFEQRQHLLAALAVRFAHGAQIALGERLNVLFDLERAQVLGQQRDALALLFGIDDVGGRGRNQHQKNRIHESLQGWKGIPQPGTSEADAEHSIVRLSHAGRQSTTVQNARALFIASSFLFYAIS